MTIFVYLKKEELKKLPGIQPEDSIGTIKIGKHRVWNEDGRPHLKLYGDSTYIPEEFAGVVAEVSLQCDFPASLGERETGIYEHESAEGVLDLEFQDNGMMEESREIYTLKIKGANMEDILELQRLIRTAKISPAESYEVSPENVELKELMESINMVSTKKLCGVQDFVKKLPKGWWPFCSKKRVARQLAAILESN